MYVDGSSWFHYKILVSSCLMFLLARFVLIVDSAKLVNPSSRQMCTKLQSMLSYGKYQTNQISSNITYVSRIFAQNFLVYSATEKLLIFIEPKQKIHVYDAQNVKLLVNLNTTDVVIGTSCISLISDSRHDLFFIYETNSETNLIFLRVCQVHFNGEKFNFEPKYCIETIAIQYDQPNLRINGFAIKRDHAGTKKSLLFISTEIGLIYTIFDTRTGSLIGDAMIMNETLNEGSVALSASGLIYYASKQENLIYELHITRDFRLLYGRPIQNNAIKQPFGLITDECNHLYIATRSMILIMFLQTSSTIRSVFSKASDLPITLERLNSTTYVYVTIKRQSIRMPSYWMFNFLYFSEPDRPNRPTRYPVTKLEEKLHFNNTTTDTDNIPILWPLSYSLISTTNITKKYTQFDSTPRKSSFQLRKKLFGKTKATFSTDNNQSYTKKPLIEQVIPDLSNESVSIAPNDILEIIDNSQVDSQEQINQSLDKEVLPETHLKEDTSSNSKYLNRTADLAETLFSEDDIHSYLQGRGNFSSSQKKQIQAYLAKQSSSDYNILSKYSNTTKPTTERFIAHLNLSSSTQEGEDLLHNEYTDSNDYKPNRPRLDSTFLNRTVDMADAIFSTDDIQSYLEGRGNLSSKQITQIQAYLSKQSSSDYNLFSKYSNSTNKPSGTFKPDHDLPSRIREGEDPSLHKYTGSNDYKPNRPRPDSTFPNRSIDMTDAVISADDVLSYLEGRGNLSSKQITQIQAYLAKQRPFDSNLFSKYSNSTNKPSGRFILDNDLLSRIREGEDPSLHKYTSSNDYKSNRSGPDSQFLNRTIDTAVAIFSENDVQSYLEGRGNLSSKQITQIQAYLAKQSLFDYNLFSNHSNSTNRPREIATPNNDLPFNRTRDTEEILFSDDDLKSYLQGRSNLSKNQKTEIQAYLAKQQFPFNESLLLNYLTNLKNPTTIDNKPSHFPPKDTQSQDHVSKSPLLDRKLFNQTTDTKENLFSDEDIQSYLQGRGNLSVNQEAQVRAYLAKQILITNKTLSRYFASTRNPRTKTLTSADKLQVYSNKQSNLSRSEQIQSSDYNPFSKYLNNTTTSSIPFKNRKQTTIRRVVNGNDDIERFPEIYTEVDYDQDISIDTTNEYSQLPRSSISPLQTNSSIKVIKQPLSDHDMNKQKPIDSNKDGLNLLRTFSTKDFSDHSSSSISSNTSLTQAPVTVPSDITKSDFISNEKLPIDDPTTRRNLTLNNNLFRFSTKFKPTTHPKFSQPTSRISLSSNIYTNQTSPDLKVSNAINKSRTYDSVRDHRRNASFNTKRRSKLSTLITTNPMHLTATFDYINKDKISQKHSSPMSVNVNASPATLPLLPFAMLNTTLFPSRHSYVSSLLHRSPAYSSTKSRKSTHFSSSKFFSGKKTTLPSPFYIDSDESEITVVPSFSTMFSSSTSTSESSHQFSSMQTTDTAITSDQFNQKPISTLSDMSSSSLITTHHPRFTPTVSSTLSPTTNEQLSTTKFSQYISKLPKTPTELSYAKSTEIFPTKYQSIPITLVPSTTIDSSSAAMSVKTSTHSMITPTTGGNRARFDYQPLETTRTLQLSSTLLPSSTTKYQNEFPSTRPSFGITSTISPNLPFTRRRSSSSRTRTTTITTSTITTTTIRRYRSRKQKTATSQIQQFLTTSTSTTTIPPRYRTTFTYDHKSSTSTQISIRHPVEQQQTIIIKPSLTTNISDTLFYNNLLNNIFNNMSLSTNFSNEKSISINLIDHPPSSWNFSLNSNSSIALNVLLPSEIFPSNSSTRTNITFANIEVNRFSTNIIGQPINLQVDRVQTKQFSLKMNTTDQNLNSTRPSQHASDVIIGHVKSEEFALNLTKSDNMHVHVQQVDSATAELYLDSNFCTKESSLEINLNLSKNGTIRYGNRTPIRIGAVFTRVHMLKQSCDREQPLTLFFDLCKQQNPCLNGGTCQSVMPDYDDISYSSTETGHVGYKCSCVLHTSGEHCQYLQYPLGYCLNGGSLFQIYDRFNQSIEKCLCSVGFHGEHCEENIDNCIGVDCSSHGVCEDGINTHKCSCYDGYFGLFCERKHVQTILLQAASRSFGVVAILLIVGIAGLVVASDIHTYMTRKHQRNHLRNKLPRVTSELFENSVLLLGFSDAPIEMTDLSTVESRNKPVVLKQRQPKKTTRYRRAAGYRQVPRRRRQLAAYSRTGARRHYI